MLYIVSNCFSSSLKSFYNLGANTVLGKYGIFWANTLIFLVKHIGILSEYVLVFWPNTVAFIIIVQNVRLLLTAVTPLVFQPMHRHALVSTIIL